MRLHVTLYKVKWNSGPPAAESTQVVTNLNGCTAIDSDPISGSASDIASGLTAAGSSLVAKGGRTARRPLGALKLLRADKSPLGTALLLRVDVPPLGCPRPPDLPVCQGRSHRCGV